MIVLVDSKYTKAAVNNYGPYFCFTHSFVDVEPYFFLGKLEYFSLRQLHMLVLVLLCRS